MELAPGTQVTPNVRLVEMLGEGGMGSVWVAYHAGLNTRVAVKFVSAELVKEEPSIMARFNREASLSAQIKSPYVVQTFDHGVMDDGRPYIVMELLEGQPLNDRLEKSGPVPLEMAALIVSQTAKALSKAHRLGIVHRDIKPDNLFLTFEDEDMFLKVLDFGIAKQTGMPKSSAVTSTGVMVGTPEYMSPEQVLSAKNVDFKSDLWALGVVAYHCLTGGVPFTGETLGSLCVSIASGIFTPVTQLREGLLPGVDAWFARALAIDPEQRFPSAKEMAIAFKASLTGTLIDDLSNPTPNPSYPDWSGQHPAVADGRISAAAVGSLGGEATVAATGSEHHVQPSPAITGDAAKRSSPTFAGTTLNPDVPRRRTLAAVGAFCFLVGIVVTGYAVFGNETTAAIAPASEGTEAPAETERAAAEPKAEPTSDVDTPQAVPSSSSTEEPSPPPSASSSRKEVANQPPNTRPSRGKNAPKPNTDKADPINPFDTKPMPRPRPRPRPRPKPAGQPDRGF